MPNDNHCRVLLEKVKITSSKDSYVVISGNMSREYAEKYSKEIIYDFTDSVLEQMYYNIGNYLKHRNIIQDNK